MVFICDKEKKYFVRLNKGSLDLTANERHASTFEKKTANNIISNQLNPHSLFKKYKWTTEEAYGITERILVENELIENINNLNIDYLSNLKIGRIKHNYELMNELLQKTTQNIIHLSFELSLLDKEKVDLEHYIEDNDLDKEQSFVFTKELHNLCVRRREIKNQIFYNSLLGDIPNINQNTFDQRLLAKTDVYKPRIRFDLFGGE